VRRVDTDASGSAGVGPRGWGRGPAGSEAGAGGGGEEGVGAALEAFDAAEGGVLVLDVHVEVGVDRGQRRQEAGPVVRVVHGAGGAPVAERHEAPGRILGPGGAEVADPGGGAL